MQKNLISALRVASIVLAAALVFVSCGSGTPDNYEGQFLKDVQDSQRLLKDRIESGDLTGGEPPTALSSSEEVDIPQSSAEEPPPPPPPVSSAPWVPSSSSFVIVVPSSSGAKPTSSATAASSSSRAQAGGAGNCRENNPKKVTCEWDHKGTLTPGTILKPAAFTPPSGCTVVWYYAPDTLGMALNYECNTLDASKGITAEGSRNYVLFAKLTCSDGEHIDACNPKTGLSSKLAPELTGTCVWSKNPTTTARGATPSGVSVIDKDGICKSKSVEYKYAEGKKTWPSDGTTGIVAGTYTDVEAVLKCAEYPVTVASSCPSLVVSAGADYQIVCNKTCKDPDPQGNYQCQINEDACGGTGKAWKTVSDGECIDVEITWRTNYYNPGIKMICESGKFPNSGGSISIQVGKDSPHKVSATSSHVRNETEIIKKLENSETPIEILNICISISEKSVTATCSLGTN